ncbi:deoxyguanosinetriphosphate triphosphohydrolase [bacterium]|nr:MAG: deoxyguanosinetriphosphate triphosphohydrolase [bacterium]
MITTSEHIRREEEYLKPFAIKNSETRGRKYPCKPHPYRPPFERDRERVIHSSSFRRLTYKTQVFVNHEGDHYRTRLTHTLETATIARSLALALGANCDLTEAIALSHDLGHTPFGHTGEEVLNELLSEVGGFEHNRQSLRVVDLLEKRYPEFDGLNLTYETREGIQKHVTLYDSAPNNDEFPEKWPSIEAQIVCVADEIAFNCHDLDDGIYSGLLDFEEVENEVPLWAELAEAARADYDGLSGELLRKEVIRRLINIQVTDTISTSDRRIEEYNPSCPDEVRRLPKRLIGYSDELTSENKILCDFLNERLYCNYKVLQMSTKARMIIESLFGVYVENPKLLPAGSRYRLDCEDERVVVADYIAGMTDRYAMLEYKKFFDPFEKLL